MLPRVPSSHLRPNGVNHGGRINIEETPRVQSDVEDETVMVDCSDTFILVEVSGLRLIFYV
jgi:hypothetical protein